MAHESKAEPMTEGRGLLTESEREALAGERSDTYRYKTRTYVRGRIEQIERDLEVLDRHAPDLLDELRTTVCESDMRADAGGDAHNTDERTKEGEDASNDPIYELDLPGYGLNLEGRQAAVRAIYEYLKEQGQGQRSDFKEVVNVEATGYAGDTPFNSFWNNCMDSGAVLAQLPGVQSPGEGGHTYTYES